MKNSIEKIFNVVHIVSIVLMALTCASTFVVNVLYSSMGENNRTLEFLFYAAVLLIALSVYSNVLFRIQSFKRKILVGSFFAMAYTLVVFLVNNIWHCVYYNNLFPAGYDPISYATIIKADILYKAGWWRYPSVFLLAFTLQFMISLFFRPGISQEIGECLWRLLGFFGIEDNRVEKLYVDATRPRSEKLIKFVQKMRPTARNKQQLKALADKYNNEVVLYLYIRKCGLMMKAEEYYFYRHKLTDVLQQNRNELIQTETELPEYIQLLDDYFQGE